MNILLIAAWGYPPAWSKYRYVINMKNQAFRSLPKFECESCSSTLAIAKYLTSAGHDVQMLIFGLDTVVDPSELGEGEGLRKHAEKSYRDWFKELARQCGWGGGNPETVMLPGRGRYYGWEFGGSVAHLFNKVFIHVLNKLYEDRDGGSNYSFIILDLTHGINFQLVTVLYAVIAAAILKSRGDGRSLEDSVLILNSEPATGKGEKCIKVQPKSFTTKELGIIDVTDLQKAVKFIRALAFLKGLATKHVERLLEGPQEVIETLRNKLIPFFKLLGNGAYGPTYVNAFLESGGREDPVGINPCTELSDSINLTVKDFEYIPTLEENRRIVSYGRATISEALKVALRVFLESTCSELKVQDLLEYLDKIGKYHNSNGHLYGYLISKDTKQSLSLIIKYISKCQESLPKEHAGIQDGTITINAVLFRALMNNTYKLRKALEKGKCEELNIEEAYKDHQNELSKLRKAKEADDKYVRHMLAHGGLEYVTLKKITIKNNKITKITYDKELLNKILQRIIKTQNKRNT